MTVVRAAASSDQRPFGLKYLSPDGQDGTDNKSQFIELEMKPNLSVYDRKGRHMGKSQRR